MKMFKLMGKRGFAVFTSLALCASLVAPSFAANFNDLQNAVNGSDGTYGENDEITRDGNKITLNGYVIRKAGEVGITIGAGKDITLDLNGNNVDYGRGDVAWGTGVHSVIEVAGSLTIQDTSEGASGEITGGWDSGVKIVDGGDVTLESGAITNSASGQYSGGVYVLNGGTFTMNGGEISGNTAGSSGGGVGVAGGRASFTMNGGVISGNTASNSGGNGGGGGVWIKDGANFIMTGGEITNNEVKKDGGNGGGVAIHQANFTMTGGKISDNKSSYGTGVLINANSPIYSGDATFTMRGGYVAGQEGTSCIYLEESETYDAKFELSGNAVMYGSIRLGQGTQVITNGVTQPNGDHDYTGFNVVDENGKKVDSIAKDETEKDGGYTLEADALLDVKYDHVYEGAWADNGNGTHSRSCIHCDDRHPSEAEKHNWNDGETQETSCTSSATTYTCQDCGATMTVATNDDDHHHWNTGVVVAQPTCTKAGLKVDTCTVCGATKDGSEETIPALNHQENGVDAASDKWGKDANNHWHTCTLCGEAVFALGAHSWGEGVETETPAAMAEVEDEVTVTYTYTCKDCGATKTETKTTPATGEEPPENPDPETPEDPGTIIDDPTVPLAPLPDEVEIDDPEVPLAGLLTRADVIGYLWEKAGSPDAALSDFADVSADDQWAVAIGWAQDMGIAVADADGNFRPDDLVLRSVEDLEITPEGEFEQFLNRYAVFAGIRLENGKLFFALDGEWDDIIMGEEAQVIFDNFFARLELALAEAA